MEILAVRHTRVAVEPGICYGQSNVPLADTFKEEASEVIKGLQQESYTRIYSSPLTRCTSLAQKLDLPIHTIDALKELNFGQWEMRTWEEIDSPESRFWMDNYLTASTLGGESFELMVKRVKTFFEECREKHKNESIVWVCHAGVIRILYHLCKAVPLSEVFSIEVNYGSIHRFRG